MVKINTVMWRAKLKETSQTSKALLLSYRMLASLTKLQLLKVLSYLLTFGTNQITTDFVTFRLVSYPSPPRWYLLTSGTNKITTSLRLMTSPSQR